MLSLGSRERLFDSEVTLAIDFVKAETRAEILRDTDGMTAKEFSCRTGLSQSDVSDLRLGKMKRFSVDRLIAVLVKLGHDPRVCIM